MATLKEIEINNITFTIQAYRENDFVNLTCVGSELVSFQIDFKTKEFLSEKVGKEITEQSFLDFTLKVDISEVEKELIDIFKN